jgi:hypothetical protein
MGLDLEKYALFVKAADVANGPLRKVLADVEPPKNYDQPTLVFTDGTKMGANKTNIGALIKAAGSKDSAALVGLEVELFKGKLPDGGGGTQDGLCLRVLTAVTEFAASTEAKPSAPKLAAVKQAPKKPPEGDDLDDPIPNYLQR